MGDADTAIWPGGEFSYREQTKKAHQVAESTYRVLRHKPAKGAATIDSDEVRSVLDVQAKRIVEDSGLLKPTKEASAT
jgi:hypothetical protein